MLSSVSVNTYNLPHKIEFKIECCRQPAVPQWSRASQLGKINRKYFVDENCKLIPYKRKNSFVFIVITIQQFRSFISHNFPFRHFQLKFCCFCFVLFCGHDARMPSLFCKLFFQFESCFLRFLCMLTWWQQHPLYAILFSFFSLAFLIMRACVLFVLRTLHKHDDIHRSSHTSPAWLKLQQGKQSASSKKNSAKWFVDHILCSRAYY